jgi:hypothetical protein
MCLLAGVSQPKGTVTVLGAMAASRLVQQSLREAIAKVLAIATSSSKLDKIAAGTSPELSIATNP